MGRSGAGTLTAPAFGGVSRTIVADEPNTLPWSKHLIFP